MSWYDAYRLKRSLRVQLQQLRLDQVVDLYESIGRPPTDYDDTHRDMLLAEFERRDAAAFTRWLDAPTDTSPREFFPV